MGSQLVRDDIASWDFFMPIIGLSGIIGQVVNKNERHT